MVVASGGQFIYLLNQWKIGSHLVSLGGRGNCWFNILIIRIKLNGLSDDV